MEETRFYILSARKLTGELTDKEVMELELIFINNPLYKEIYDQLELNVPLLKRKIVIDEQVVLSNLQAKLQSDPAYNVSAANDNEQQQHIKTYRNKKYKIVYLSIIFLFTSGILFSYYLEKEDKTVPSIKISENNISTKSGSKTQVTLPDGSTVILNADSKLTYPDNFLGDKREVTLEGEAFFDVTENKHKPFIIHSKNMDIKVIGTVFNVKAYPMETISEAALISGSIEVYLKNRTNEKIMLKPNEKITVANTPISTLPETSVQNVAKEILPIIQINKLKKDESDNQVNEIAWTQNKLIFKNEKLDGITILLERWYGVNVSIETSRLKTVKFTGRFHTESITQVLKALQLTHPFSYTNKNGNIVIY